MQIYKGNLKEDGKETRGWILGHFIEDKDTLRHTDEVEIKWGDHKKGEEKGEWSTDNDKTIVTILIKGKEKVIFENEEVELGEGEYLITSPGNPHKWKMLEDTLVVTIKWPSK